MKKSISPFKILLFLIFLAFLFTSGCFAADTSDNKNKISAAMQGVLFPHGMDSITPKNIMQGRFGDCQAIAAISSLAGIRSGGEIIMSYFSNENEQHVTVTLPGSSQPFDVTIADIENNKSYARTLDGGLWLAVLEKAIALYNRAFYYGRKFTYYNADDEFAHIIHGTILDDSYYLKGISGRLVMKLLTNSDAYKIPISELSLNDLHRKLTTYTACSKIVTASTSCAMNDDGGEITEALPSCHAYSILWYDPDEKLVTLRNPHGESGMLDTRTGQPLDKFDDGVFSLSLGKFKEDFNTISFLTSGEPAELVVRNSVDQLSGSGWSDQLPGWSGLSDRSLAGLVCSDRMTGTHSSWMD